MRSTISIITSGILLSLLLSLSGCSDWHLRGTRTDVVPVKRIYLSAGSARQLRRALIQELRYAGVGVTQKRSTAEATIELLDEDFDRRVLSVDPDSGKVREVELGLEVKFSVRDANGKILVPVEKLSWVQDFVFDESSLLGTNERESIIERELSQDAAQAIILRLEALKFPST